MTLGSNEPAPAGAPPHLPHLSGPEGLAALAQLMASQALFAFDFDGTLAPIRPRPSDVHVSTPIAKRLDKLTRTRPVAIVTGRSIADVRERLGFAPTWIVGNHGAEDDGDPGSADAAARALDGLRLRLHENGQALAAAGVVIEDKRQSLALHYRTASDRAAASRSASDGATRTSTGRDRMFASVPSKSNANSERSRMRAASARSPPSSSSEGVWW